VAYSVFTASHRGGRGSPLVCLHGFMDTWRTWELVLPALERAASDTLIADAVERAMDDAGFATAHVVGNSLGGYVALQLAARGRAQSVVALAPAGGWAATSAALDEILALQAAMHEQAKLSAPHAEAILASAEGRRRATRLIVESFEHIPAELIAHQVLGVASARGVPALIEHGLREGYGSLDAQRIACPVRIVWGTADRLLPWPSAAARFRDEWLPHADWVELEGVGHCPQLDVPLEAAQLIAGFTAR
jgi:pimeloyl-ACP methyl ester carboxylesterase